MSDDHPTFGNIQKLFRRRGFTFLPVGFRLPEPVAPPPRKAFVYVIPAGEIFKVGVAKNIGRRLSGLRVGNPMIDEPLLTVQFEEKDAYKVEGLIHTELRQFCVGGEWFNCDPSLAMNLLKMLAGMNSK